MANASRQTSPDPLEALAAPLHIGAVTLAVRDLDRVGDYYRRVIGLERTGGTPDRLELGAGGVTLLALERRPSAEPESGRSAGLFHTAFVLPTRAGLGRWLAAAMDADTRFAGAADHLVSEALYLNDPEHNGIEIYRDRPRAEWPMNGRRVAMRNDPLDRDGILAAGRAAGEPQVRMPDGTRVGHIHLRTGDVAASEAFFGEAMGLDVMQTYDAAVFLSSGGYHHHVAANVWRSAGAGPRPKGTTGLLGFEMIARDASTLDGLKARLDAKGLSPATQDGALRIADPYGIPITVRTARP